jgi:hypothetical protein
LATTTSHLPDDWTTRPGWVFPSGNRYERVLASLPEGTTRPKEVRGRLALFREATPVYCALTADEVGAAKKLGDVDCNLLEWRVTEESIAVTWERASAQPDFMADSRLRATMLAEDGTILEAHGRGGSSDPNKARETYLFRVVQGNQLKSVIEGFLRRDPQPLLDFTIPHIRLP